MYMYSESKYICTRVFILLSCVCQFLPVQAATPIVSSGNCVEPLSTASSDEEKLRHVGYNSTVAKKISEDPALTQKILSITDSVPVTIYRGLSTDIYSFDPKMGASKPTDFGGSHFDARLSQPLQEASKGLGYGIIMESQFSRALLRKYRIRGVVANLPIGKDEPIGEVVLPLGQVESLRPFISRMGFVFSMAADFVKDVNSIHWFDYEKALLNQAYAQTELSIAYQKYFALCRITSSSSSTSC